MNRGGSAVAGMRQMKLMTAYLDASALGSLFDETLGDVVNALEAQDG